MKIAGVVSSFPPIRHRPGWILHVCCVLLVWALGACASLPPGAAYPKQISTALPHPELTRLGMLLAGMGTAQGNNSGFRIISAGLDGFSLRLQMINAAEKSLDLQYYIFHGDETGRLLTEALLQAADRGVRVRLLIDDGDTEDGDEQVNVIRGHPSIELRIFNPFAYRGHNDLIRGLEFILNAPRLDYRMHNKIMIVDNSAVLFGGRNIGDQYFQIDPSSQMADDDLFSIGPITRPLSQYFDVFWNSDLSIPAQAIERKEISGAALVAFRTRLQAQNTQSRADIEKGRKSGSAGDPLAGILAGRLPLTWAPARLIGDSPDKQNVENDEDIGSRIAPALFDYAGAVQTELLMITPYLIPGTEGMRLFRELRQRQVKIRLLTNSLESSTELVAQSGYMAYRIPLLEEGIDLYEIRSLIGNARGSGQALAMSRHGNYSLHAKLFVFDRRRLFIGSMNFDQRSMHLNTEIGVVIDSPPLALQVAARFSAMVQPANSYKLELGRRGETASSGLVWITQEDNKRVEYDREPARSFWQRLEADLISLLPIDSEL